MVTETKIHNQMMTPSSIGSAKSLLTKGKYFKRQIGFYTCIAVASSVERRRALQQKNSFKKSLSGCL